MINKTPKNIKPQCWTQSASEQDSQQAQLRRGGGSQASHLRVSTTARKVAHKWGRHGPVVGGGRHGGTGTAHTTERSDQAEGQLGTQDSEAGVHGLTTLGGDLEGEALDNGVGSGGELASGIESKWGEVSVVETAHTLVVLAALVLLSTAHASSEGQLNIGGGGTVEATDINVGGVELTKQPRSRGR